MIARLTTAAIVAAAGALAWAYGARGIWVGAAVGCGAGALWLAGLWRQRRRVSALALAACLGTIVIGATLPLPIWPLLLGLIATLAAWDLEHLAARLRYARSDTAAPEVRALQRCHLARLGAVSGVGGVLAAVAATWQVRFGLEVAFLLGALAVFGLSRALRFMRRESD